MIFLIVLGCTLGWFGFGAVFAPKSAAWGYQNSAYYPNNIRYAKDSAALWYWWTIFFGPIVALLWLAFFTGRVIYRPASANGQSRLEMGLVKHDQIYRKDYLYKIERENDRLERENESLTKDILG